MDEEAALTDRAATDEDAVRPLVTFALFAYNQEHYVREAIEGALAQTYAPLEIILSDDCSTDGTFAIMQEMAAAYSGPHRVTARQSPQNRRVLRHVLDVASLARGKYMIVAAGDDISLACRTEKLVEVFEREGADFCWSAYGTFNDNQIEKRYFSDEYSLRSDIFGLPVSRIYGATAAYRISKIHEIPVTEKAIFYEDSFFELFAEISASIVYFCPDQLVEYRLLENSLSMKFSRDAASYESRFCVHSERLSETVLLAIETFCAGETLQERPEISDCRDLAAFYRRASSWKEMTFLERMRHLSQVPSRKALKWFLPRAILGWDLFVILKGWQLKYK